MTSQQSTSAFSILEALSQTMNTTIPKMISTGAANRAERLHLPFQELAELQPRIDSSLKPAGRGLLETYSGIDPSNVKSHV